MPFKDKNRKKEYHKEYYQKNKDKLREDHKKYHCNYYLKNKDKINKKHKKYRGENKEYRKKYCQENKKKFKKYQKEYQENHKEESKKYHKKYNRFPKVRERDREYRKKSEVKNRYNLHRKNKRKINTAWATRSRLRILFIQAFKKFSQTGKIMSSKKYGIDYKAIIEHLKPLPKDLTQYHIHHIKPLFTFNFNDAEQIKIAFRPENHKLLTIEEHRKLNHRRLKK